MGPIDADVMLNKGTLFAVHCLEGSGVGFILIIRDRPPEFLLARRAKKDMECVAAIREKPGAPRPAPTALPSCATLSVTFLHLATI